ncbi:MerR family transcriptional regulator [Brevibacillus reuszeri]|uniref:MerR family transcriptional regulator n=1 Tax=Brevibacillus reuszeri TaxID=54915 RepID=UPI000CCC2638|nr:MerR family transcriptional regulator [Brevibacillus reuszeri]
MKVNRIYTIGEFSKISKVSSRMLRHYDKVGLLKPSYVDQNGYRYYSDEEMYNISMIKQFRRYGFSLDEVKKIISKNDVEYTKQMLQLKIDYLQHSTTENHYLVVELEKQIRGITGEEKIVGAKRSYDVLTGHRGEFLALCQRKRTKDVEIDQMIDELYGVIAASNDLVSLGTHMTIFHQSYSDYDPDKTDIEVCIPVNAEYKTDAFYTQLIEGGFYMSTIFYGSYDSIGNAYITLINWAKQNNYSIIGPTVERYYRDIRVTNNHSEYITEICIPIAKQKQGVIDILSKLI